MASALCSYGGNLLTIVLTIYYLPLRKTESLYLVGACLLLTTYYLLLTN